MPAPPVPLASRLAHQSTHLHQRATDTLPGHTAPTPAPPALGTPLKLSAARDPSHARPTETPSEAASRNQNTTHSGIFHLLLPYDLPLSPKGKTCRQITAQRSLALSPTTNTPHTNL